MSAEFRKISSEHILVAVCCLIHFASYITRLSYVSVISEIVITEGIAKSLAAIATTVSFVTYATGQFASGWLGDRYPPKWIIIAGLLSSSVMNVIITFASGVTQMAVIWGINGIAQAMVWPPLVKILATNFSGSSFVNANRKVIVSGSVGTVFLYIFAPFCIGVSGWRFLFYCVSCITAIISVICLLVLSHYEKTKQEHRKERDRTETEPEIELQPPAPISSILTVGFLAILPATTIFALIRDGVLTWMPLYIVDNFHLSSSISIFSSVIIPIFSIFAYNAFGLIHKKYIRDEIKCATFCFGLGACAALVLAVFFALSSVLAIFLAMIIAGCMYGATLMILGVLPARFTATGKTAFITGVLNALSYFGSALSAYGIAYFVESKGWQQTVVLWTFLLLAGAICCIISRKHFDGSHRSGII